MTPRFLRAGFAALAGLAIAVAVGMHIHRMAGWTFTNYDDVVMQLTVDRIRNHGWAAYNHLAAEYALWQGRGYFYFTMFFFILPFFLRSLLVRAVLAALLQLAATGAVGAVVGSYAGFRAAALYVALVAAMLPYWRTVSPVNGFPFVYQLPVLLFFSALAVHIRRMRRGVRTGRGFVWAAFCVSLFFYEALIPLFGLLALAVSTAEARRAYGKWDRSIALRAWTPWAAGFALWLVVYLGFRLLHPSTYTGNAVVGIGAREWGHVAACLFYFEASSLPGANWIGNANGIVSSPSTEEGIAYGHGLWRNLTPEAAILAGLIFGAVVLGSLLWSRGPREADAPRRLRLAAALALVCALCSPLPLVLTPKYRVLATVREVIPYLTGYYSYLAWCAALALAVPLLSCAWRNRPALRWTAAVVLAGACALGSAATSVANAAVSREYAGVTDKWKMADRLARTRWFRTLPPDPVLLAPGLWNDFPPPAWPLGDTYWSEYLSGWAGRPVKVIRDVHQLAGLLEHRAPVYYYEHQWLPGRMEAVLLAQPIDAIAPADGNARAHSLVVMARRPAHLRMEYRAAGPDPVEIPLSAWREEQGAWVAAVSTPDAVVGTARVFDPSAAPLPAPPVDVQFGRGFTPVTERDGGHYFRWSDGADGEGELNLANYAGRPLAVRFRAALHFYEAERQAVFDFRTPQGSESLTATPGQAIERVWQLAPGDNRVVVKCHAARLPAPGDRRYIVFGIWDWSSELVEGR